MAYSVRIKPAAMRQLEKMRSELRLRIFARLEALAEDPFPSGCKKLTGIENSWRIRIGSYRIIYQVQQKLLVILVLTIGHRRDVYR